jgi:hypothetical protein
MMYATTARKVQMPHYMNGHVAKPGDIVRGFDFSGNPVEGLVTKITSDGEDCNLEVLPIPREGRLTMIARKCLPADDHSDITQLAEQIEKDQERIQAEKDALDKRKAKNQGN